LFFWSCICGSLNPDQPPLVDCVLFSVQYVCCGDARAPGCDIPSESSSSKHPARKYTSSNLVPASGPQARLALHQHQMVASRDNMCWPMPVSDTTCARSVSLLHNFSLFISCTVSHSLCASKCRWCYRALTWTWHATGKQMNATLIPPSPTRNGNSLPLRWCSTSQRTLTQHLFLAQFSEYVRAFL